MNTLLCWCTSRAPSSTVLLLESLFAMIVEYYYIVILLKQDSSALKTYKQTDRTKWIIYLRRSQ